MLLAEWQTPSILQVQLEAHHGLRAVSTKKLQVSVYTSVQSMSPMTTLEH